MTVPAMPLYYLLRIDNMNRKDYELIAANLKQYVDADNANRTHLASAGFEPTTPDRSREQRTRLICRDMAAALQLDNQEFDSIKFFKACGL